MHKYNWFTLNSYLDKMLIFTIENLCRLLILSDTIAVVTARGNLPCKLHRFAHGECGGMLLFLLRIGGELAHEVLARVNGIAVVEDLAVQMSRPDRQLASEGLEEGGLACGVSRQVGVSFINNNCGIHYCGIH